MYRIDYNSVRSVQSFNRRVRFLVFHYTAQNFAGSVKSLTGPLVSAHYLIPDPSDSSYIAAGYRDMRIFNLVDENERAWHAGVSTWSGRNNLNDTSIGIEIVNQASENNGIFTFPPFHPMQVEAVVQLTTSIVQRYPDITPVNLVGHSDIAPGRKSDPGAAFPWRELYAADLAAWYDEPLKQQYQLQFCQQLPVISELINRFKRYGYDTSATINQEGLKNLVRAFQLHFRPEKYDGVIDAETAAILYALIDKYFPQRN